MHILIVLTSHDRLGDTGHKTGFWLEEFAAPYYVFKDAGARITLASPAGGQPPLDPRSDEADAQTPATERFRQDSEAQQLLASTVPLAQVKAAEFDAVFYPGGHGPLWDLTNDAASIALLEFFARADKPAGLVCHAPAALVKVRGADGQPWIAGRRVTGFSNSEEEAVGLTAVVPLLLEDEFKRLGGLYEKGPDWQSHVVTDGRLVTGQNPGSSAACAQALLQQLA